MDRKGLLDKVTFYGDLNKKEPAVLRSGSRTFQAEAPGSRKVVVNLFCSRNRRMELTI